MTGGSILNAAMPPPWARSYRERLAGIGYTAKAPEQGPTYDCSTRAPDPTLGDVPNCCYCSLTPALA